MSILDSVLAAQRRDLHVFPCDSSDKRPMSFPDGRRLQWGAAASLDQEAAKRLWTSRPNLNFGVAAKPSNLLIIDCDMPKSPEGLAPRLDGPGVRDGLDVLAQITVLLGVPYPSDTLTVRTPSGGMHLYFRNVTGELMSQASPVPGWLDVRGNGGERGGYVVGFGSMINGEPYQVVVDAPIAPAPGWLVRLARHREPVASKQSPFKPWASHEASIPKLQPLLDTFRNAADGNQNAAGHWAAASAAKDGVPLSEAIDAFWANTPPATQARPWLRSDVETMVRSGYRTAGVIA